jgi:hypothetical protein
VSRRKSFDPQRIPPEFWTRADVAGALCERDMTALFRVFFAAFAECTQVQLALLTGHDRADISNWVRGTRQARVGDIDVLERIAEGMAMPDAARVRLGLAPATQPLSAFAGGGSSSGTPASGSSPFGTEPARTGIEVAVCGSRVAGANTDLIDRMIPLLARLVMLQRWSVSHGPVGVGIEVMTYLADHYRPAGTLVVIGRVGHERVVETCDYLIGLGGGAGTMVELDLAAIAGKKMLLLPASGGAVAAYAAATTDPDPYAWLSANHRAALGSAEPEVLIETVKNAIRTDRTDSEIPSDDT